MPPAKQLGVSSSSHAHSDTALRSPASRRTPTRIHSPYRDSEDDQVPADWTANGDANKTSKLDGTEDASNNEHSPLLLPQNDASFDRHLRRPPSLEADSDDDWSKTLDDREDTTRSQLYLLLLTLGGLGLSICWSVETSHFSPFLLSLGLSKSLLALVWIAGPLSGVVVQPYVGVRSDKCQISWGRRKPFMIGGALSTIVSMMLLAWAKEIVGGFLSIFGVERTSSFCQSATITFAVAFVYILDFAINVIQAALRAFIVDCAPTHQQEDANAWAMRTQGIGQILGFLSGYIDLPKVAPFLGKSQFQALNAIACLVMAVTVGISISCIKERNPHNSTRKMSLHEESNAGILAFFRDLLRAMRRLPPQIRSVCIVQFFAWIGWFPFLFYITTYVGEIWSEHYWEEDSHRSMEDVDQIWEKSARIGTYALLISAIITFMSSVVLPFFIAPAYADPKSSRNLYETAATPLTPATPVPSTPRSTSRPSSTRRGKSRHDLKPPRLTSLLTSLRIPSLTLRRTWLLSHLTFATLMFLTLFARSTTSATFLVAAVGVPWAVTGWAPFALIAAEVSRRDAVRRHRVAAPPTRDGSLLASGEDNSVVGSAADEQAGVILGIHNVAVAAPQAIATLVSSAMFAVLQKERGQPGDESVAWVLRFGGCCALVAAWFTRYVED